MARFLNRRTLPAEQERLIESRRESFTRLEVPCLVNYSRWNSRIGYYCPYKVPRKTKLSLLHFLFSAIYWTLKIAGPLAVVSYWFIKPAGG